MNHKSSIKTDKNIFSSLELENNTNKNLDLLKKSSLQIQS